jgi:cobyrinic acid a,c-diamide synthase
MVGSIPGDAVMHRRPQGRGYVRLRETAALPWPGGDAAGEIAAHEFHYSSLDDLAPPAAYGFEVLRGAGIDGRNDGYLYRNLVACYTHQRTTRRNRWTERFLRFVASCESRRIPAPEGPRQ